MTSSLFSIDGDDNPPLAQRVQAFLSYCASCVPFYAPMRSILDSEEVMSGEGWRRIPLMGKEQLRQGFPDQLIPKGARLQALLAADKLLSINTSSGTSDERVSVLYDQRLNAYPEAAQTAWGLEKPLTFLNKTAVLTSPICAGFECHFEEKSYRERIRGRTLTCFTARNVFLSRERDLRQFHEELCTFRPDVFLANPAYAAWIGAGLVDMNVTPYSPKLILSSYQWLTHNQRRFLEKTFNCPVFNYYSATDLGGAIVGYEDLVAPDLLINSRDVLVEIVPLTDCEDDRYGHIVVTTLSNRKMPLVRYVVGDLGQKRGDRLVLAGRRKEAMIVGTKLITLRDIDDVMKTDPETLFYALTQEDDGESLMLRVVRPTSLAGELLERLTKLFDDRYRISIKSVERIELERSLKTSYVRSLCPPRSPV